MVASASVAGGLFCDPLDSRLLSFSEISSNLARKSSSGSQVDTEPPSLVGTDEHRSVEERFQRMSRARNFLS